MGKPVSGRLLRAGLVGVLVLAAAGCAAPRARLELPEPLPGSIRLSEKNVAVRMSPAPQGSAPAPLLLYATGDGGWRSLDREIFDRLAAWGCPVAGISSGAYLEARGYAGETTPVHLARTSCA